MRAKTYPVDPIFPHLRTAIDQVAMREWFVRMLRPIADGSFRLHDCRLSRLRHRQGERCILQYSLTLEERCSGIRRNQIVTCRLCSESRARHVVRKVKQASNFQVIPEFTTAFDPVTYIPELGMLVQAYPADYRLPGLSRLVADPPPALQSLLLLRFGEGNWAVERCIVDTVRYRVGLHAVLRYTLFAKNKESGKVDAKRFYVKIYPVEKSAEMSRILDCLGEVCRREQLAFNVEPPITYLKKYRALVLKEASGTPFDTVVRPGGNVVTATRRIAGALAAFQTIAISPPRIHTPWDEKHQLARAADTLARDCPHLNGEVGAILAATSAARENTVLALTHGDPKLRHMFLNGDQINFIDLDEMAVADPLLDVAVFLADLTVLGIKHNVPRVLIQNMAQAFTTEYFQSVPWCGQDRLLQLYFGVALKRASNMVRRQKPQWRAHVDRLIGEATPMRAQAILGQPTAMRVMSHVSAVGEG